MVNLRMDTWIPKDTEAFVEQVVFWLYLGIGELMNVTLPPEKPFTLTKQIY